jgi:hypothetical protein
VSDSLAPTVVYGILHAFPSRLQRRRNPDQTQRRFRQLAGGTTDEQAEGDEVSGVRGS